MFGVDSNWQVQNGFEYFMKRQRPGVAWFTTDDLAWLTSTDATERFRSLVETSRRAGRDLVITPDVAATLAAHGVQLHVQDIDRLPGGPSRETILASQLAELHPRTLYALGILRPNRESPLDMPELTAAWAALTGAATQLPALGNYTIAIGEVGQPPLLIDSRDRPFRIKRKIDSADFDVRMESWLPTDTIRRAGFGQVIINRRHVLILERGVSFVALGPLDQPELVVYRSGIFAPLARLTLPPCDAIPCPM